MIAPQTFRIPLLTSLLTSLASIVTSIVASMAIWMLATAIAQAKVFKMATQAPLGSNWANNLQEMAREVAEKTQNRVQFKIYYGGVSGDEPDVLRKIRIGQMQGALFTGRTLGEIYSDAQLIEAPFSFRHDRAKAVEVLNAMTPAFNRGFEQNGFTNLGFFEVGRFMWFPPKRWPTSNS